MTVDLKAPGTDWTTVTGATIASQIGEILTIDLGAIGVHAVRIGHQANVGPAITSFGGGATGTLSIAENGTALTTIAATDANIALGDSIRYSIATGGDGANFSIDATTGVLKFVAGFLRAQLQRKVVVELTTKSRRLVDKMAARVDARYLEIESQLGPQVLARLFELLERVAALPDPAQVEAVKVPIARRQPGAVARKSTVARKTPIQRARPLPSASRLR